ncbi:ribonuclease H family protein [Peptostreptococcus equinus]|uniref:ribonuclease H n=1 Tax=Peptostreptococcus equinus TaxID=3003601 RepID=A0ABY7JPQ4_9FIRM|nr:ribonuclease H family protein [Peptostreptococcus sp. CBA3647]WAW13998.1 ribonuclease H family protein [Peptostreptococcus sp. CBA3647]
MKKNKFYAVRNGKVNGIYLSWNDCKEMISGFSNASYKSFEDPYEAIDYLLARGKYEDIKINYKEDNKILNNLTEGNKVSIDKSMIYETKTLHIDDGADDNDTYEAYVDGSFETSKKVYGSGVVILKNGKIIETMSKKGSNINNLSMRNVAGEIEAAIIAIDYAIKNNIGTLNIHFDYNGIEKWCTGEWKANKDGTKYYKQFCDEAKKKIKINFIKVKAHTGVEFNELADKLAKESIL